MRGDIEFRYLYRHDQIEPIAQYRYEYYTIKRHNWMGWWNTYETIKGKWIDMPKRDAVYIPLIKAMQQYS